MPGMRWSMPYLAVPLDLEATSTRAISVPMILNWLMGLSMALSTLGSSAGA
ncbi:MAG: hypothetical protein WCJ99_17000 [Betaproteobacteria bacterium]